MQNNSSGNQNASLQAGPNPDSAVKPKFKCTDCDFNCSSLQNFRIHLQMAHQTTNETVEKLSALKKAVQEIRKTQPVKNFEPVKEPKKVYSSPPVIFRQVPQKVNPAGNSQPAQGISNVNPSGNVQPAPGIKNVNPTGKFQPVQILNKMNPAVKMQPAQPVKNMNPTGKFQSVQILNKMNPAGKVQPVQILNKMNPAGKVQPAQPIKNMNPTGKFQSVEILNKMNPVGKIKPAQMMKNMNPAGNVQAVQEKQKGKPEGKGNPVQEKQNEKPAGNVPPEDIPESSKRQIVKLKDYIARRDREPLIGLEYVLEYNIRTTLNHFGAKYFCELCECDLELDPMVEHIAGFGHRKLYLAKEYPYVLKAQSSSKEDPSKFIRRMALEIEREEGTKMYLVDAAVWSETMMTLRTADRKMRKKSRWADDKNDESRMKKALSYLESFEIDSEIEATTVTRLCEKLTVNLKNYSTKAKEDALFPHRVARAQDVAKSLVKNAETQRSHLQNAGMKKAHPNMPPQQNKRPQSLPGNANMENKFGMQNTFSGKNFQNTGKEQNMPKLPPNPQSQQSAFNPSINTNMPRAPLHQQVMQNTFGPPINANQNMPRPPLYQQAQQNAFPPPMNANQNMPRAPMYQQSQQNAFVPSNDAAQNAPRAPPYQLSWKKSFVPLNSNKAVPEAFTSKENETSPNMDSVLKNISQDDTHFFKKLVSLLEMIPQSSSPSDGAQSSSKLQMLKSLLVSQKNAEQEQANQKLMTQIASMVKDTISAQNATLNQQLMMLMTSQNSTSMVMQAASLNNSLMAPMQMNDKSVMGTAGLVSGIQNMGNMQMSMSTMMPYQNVGNQVYGQMGEMATSSMNPNVYQVPPAEMQNYPSTSQTLNPQPPPQALNYGYGNSVGNAYSQHDGNVKTVTAVQSGQPHIPYPNVGGKPSVYDKPWDNSYSNSSQVVGVGPPPSSSQTQHDDYYDNRSGEIGIQDSRAQNSVRSYNSSGWDGQEGDMPYTKRARLDMDNQPNRLEHSNNESLESLGINTAGMPEDLIMRLRGKDLFTASAILSEYSERHVGK